MMQTQCSTWLRTPDHTDYRYHIRDGEKYFIQITGTASRARKQLNCTHATNRVCCLTDRRGCWVEVAFILSHGINNWREQCVFYCQGPSVETWSYGNREWNVNLH